MEYLLRVRVVDILQILYGSCIIVTSVWVVPKWRLSPINLSYTCGLGGGAPHTSAACCSEDLVCGRGGAFYIYKSRSHFSIIACVCLGVDRHLVHSSNPKFFIFAIGNVEHRSAPFLGREDLPFGWIAPPSTRNTSIPYTFLSTVDGRSAPLPVVGMPIIG